MHETFTLKQQHAQTRQELSNALYQNDAAKRVIARLMKERDDAREAVRSFKFEAGNATAPGSGDMDVDEGQGTGLPAAVVTLMDAKNAE